MYKIKGFTPYIFVVFLNAFTDLGHKIIVQNTVFKVYDGNEQIFLTAIVNALILLPFIFLFSPSGFISDKYQKNKVMKVAAIAAVVITSLITVSYYLGEFWIAFGLTFALAIQSAIYSPAKYGYIKELTGNENLAPANAAVQSTTIVAILGGIFFYSIGFEYLIGSYVEFESSTVLQDIAPLGWILIFGSLVELYFAYLLPERSITKKEIRFDKSKYIKGGYLKRNLKVITTNQMIWLSIVGLSVFWALSQVVLAIYGAFAKESLGIENVALMQGLMALSGIGIIFGSLVSSLVSKHYIEIGIVPIGAFGIFISILLIPNLDSVYFQAVNFFAFGLFGGLFIVPLNSLIQFNSSKKRLGLVIAGNNFVQNVMMVSFLVATIFISILNIDVVLIFYILSVIALCGAVYTIYKLPQSMFKFIIALFVSSKYRLKVLGLNNMPETGGVLLLGNHISWLDWAMVQMATPRRIRFVMERSIYENRFFKPFLDFFGVIPISNRAGKSSLQKVTHYLNSGEVVCIFPEGSISRNGHLGEFKKGFEIAARNANAVIIPFYIGGLWGTRFSRSNINFAEENKRIFVKDVIVSFGEKIDINSTADQLKSKIFELSIDSWNGYISSFDSIDKQWLRTAKIFGTKTALIDSSGEKFSYYKTLTLSVLFANIIKKLQSDNIGLLLPTTSIGSILNLSVLIAGKTSVNINYTASSDAISSAIVQANIKTIYTSRRFLKKLDSKGIPIEQIVGNSASLVYLEDLKQNISKAQFLKLYMFSRFLPEIIFKKLYFSSNDLSSIATILFSSGSEGEPKGVVLTHKNILANIKQVSDVINQSENEVFLSSLPMFHAFGLTVTTFLPLIEGIKAVCHPDPTDASGIGKAVAKYNVTFMCATSTFLRLYTRNKKLNPLMFNSLKMVIAGAERLSPTVRSEFKQKFSLNIYEGYGATECSPAISTNIPDAIDTKYWSVQIGSKIGTVGMPLPGCSLKVVDPNTLKELETGEDGLLIVSGPNVMKEYLNNKEKTQEALINIDDKVWYKTGDKGHIDKDGFITIVDRYSRFAKIAGEMVSLSAVEEAIAKIINNDEAKCVCVNIPDEKKGEGIVLLIDQDIYNLKNKIVTSGINPLWIPSKIVNVDEIPMLGAGKVNFGESKLIALAQ